MNSSALLDSPNGPVSSRSAPLALTPCSSAPPWSHSRRWRQLAIVTASTCLASVGFVMTGHPVSAGVNGCGVVTVDFTDRNTYHNAVGGTRVDFTYERYWIDSGEHQVMTRQTVDIAGAGPTQPVTGVIVAGLTNRKPDGSLTRTQDCESPTGRTQVTSFIWSDVAGSRGLFGFSVQPDLSRRLDAVDFKFTLTLRRDTYTSGGSRWMSAFQGQEFGGQPNPTPLTWQPGEPHPVTVLSVMHGLYSVEMSEANQIHIGIDDVRYAELPSCIQSPYCPDTAWDFKACGAMGAEVRPADKMKVYSGTHQNDVCSARCPDTPCGCVTDCTGAQWWIGPPGEPQDHHPVWYVYDGMPLRYRVQCDTLIPWTLCALWVDAFGVAADTWNDALTQSGSTRRIITSRSTCPLSDTVKIKIYSRRALPAPLVEYDLQGRRIEHYGNTYYGIHKDMKDYCQNDIFYIRELNIAINGDNPYDDDASDEMTSREWEFPTPSGLYMQPDPKMHLAAHELGHVLGLSEGGGWPIGPEGAPPPPGTPHPPPSGVHMSVNPMIINTLATGYHETPIDPVISPGDRDTAKCLFFR